ncbi:Cobalt-precorrin-3b C17-methyltransferase [Clostridiaceae bacterium JG1575]|nr:Cobalt-precorrin-3b C17-methyltransferase [Clostridiaceae bacterium JG1575]
MKIYAVGLGPGGLEYLIPKALEVINESEVIVGYTAYVKLIEPLLEGKMVLSTGMMGEVERCKLAIEKAQEGKKVTVVSSGDSGIYGMAGLLMELLGEDSPLQVEVIPGITAASAAGALLGAPLSNDFAVVSLSDLMTPWPVIQKRLQAAAAGDFVLCLYNPMSKKRTDYLRQAAEYCLLHRSKDTPCGIVRNAGRPDECLSIVPLSELITAQVDMFTIVLIGNSQTVLLNGRLVTRRGYRV